MEKVCPIAYHAILTSKYPVNESIKSRVLASLVDAAMCIEEECAWWDRELNCCAILHSLHE